MKNSPFHSKRFWFGIVFFIGLVFVSCLFTWYGKNLYSNPQMLLKNENGAVSQAAPFNPLLMPPLGSDRSGYNMFFNLIIGAKFTIVFVFGVTLIQMLLGTLLGCLLAYMPFKLQKFVQKVFKVYFYVPAVVWVILFMMPLMLKSQEIGFNQVTVVKQFLILCIIMLPNIIMYINQEINLFMKKDYITSSVVLGARKIHLFKRHIWLSLKEILVILFLQQAVQVFTLLIHMGYFGILIGGRNVQSDPFSDTTTIFSLTNEWSGLIGLNKSELITAPWIVLAPLFFFTVSIFVLNCIVQGVQKQYNIRFLPTDQQEKEKKDKQNIANEYIISDVEKFKFAKKM